MKTNMYSIYDTAIAAYKPIWACPSDAAAQREFTDIFDADNPISKHPEDYYLVRLGSFNDQNGHLQGDTPETICTGLEALALKNKDAQNQNLIN